MMKVGRRRFLNSSIGILGLPVLAGVSFNGKENNPENIGDQAVQIRFKGKSDSRIKHWDLITIGNLSRNRYWGESDEVAVRSVICTSTLINVENTLILVDPSVRDKQQMNLELNRRTGLNMDDIDIVFITHQHGDHVAGLPHFQKARWFAGSEVAEELNRSGQFSKKIEAAGDDILGAVEVISTPGHTPDHKSLRFDFKGLSVLIASDAVATYDFWTEKKMFYNAVDVNESLNSLNKIEKIADVIVPGHDNYFLNLTS